MCFKSSCYLDEFVSDINFFSYLQGILDHDPESEDPKERPHYAEV